MGCIADKIKLKKEHDRRIKLTQQDKDKIKQLYSQGISIRAIARIGICSRRMIQYILFPERATHAKELYKQRRKDGRYYNRKKHSKSVKSLRNYKRKIYNLPYHKNMIRP